MPSSVDKLQDKQTESMDDRQMIHPHVETEAVAELWPALPCRSSSNNLMLTLFWLESLFLRSLCCSVTGVCGDFYVRKANFGSRSNDDFDLK